MKYIKLLALLISLFPITNSFAQEPLRKRNAVYLEAGGNAVFYSINYDRTFSLSHRFAIAPRAGIMFLPISKVKSNDTYSNFSVPLELNFLWYLGKEAKNAPEVGLGYNLIGIKDGYRFNSDTTTTRATSRFAKVATLRVGFRHQKPEGGLMYRLGVVIPFAQDEYSDRRVGDDIFYRVYGGASIGWSF